MIYLDNSATTAIAPEVREAMQPYLESDFGNASSVHQLGARARVALEQARETIAQHINADAKEIVFTSSGTEASNLALKGPFFHRYFSGIPWTEQELITSPVEHHSVLHPAEFLGRLGVELRSAVVDGGGHVEIESLAAELSPKTVVTSVMMVNNEVGSINPVAEIAKLAHERSGSLVHTDAVQALGKMTIDVRSLGVDLATLSAHKIHGPKGIGALYTRSGIQWEPMMHGGAQERNRRGGTESVAHAVGFAAAITLLDRSANENARKLKELHRYVLTALASIPEVIVNSREPAVDGIVSLSFRDDVLSRLDADALIIRFDMAGIAVSNGSACTSGSMQPSHVLLAMGKGKEIANKSVRLSLSRYNTTSEIDAFIATLKSIIA